MPRPAFLTHPDPPSMQELAARVGGSWQMVELSIQRIPRTRPIWKHSKTSGWYLTFDIGNKRLFYVFPQLGDMLLKIVYNDKGVQALQAKGLVAEKLKAAKKYAEGTLIEFRSSDLDAGLLIELLRIKAASIR